MDSIFVAYKVEEGFWHSHGQARLEADSVLFEYQNVDAFFHVIKSKVHDMRIPIGEIEHVEFTTAWMGLDNALRLKTRSMKTVEDFPHSQQGWITLAIERADRERAAEFASRLRLHVSELALKRLEHQPAPALNAPPVPPV
jgi:hypothetical protein